MVQINITDDLSQYQLPVGAKAYVAALNRLLAAVGTKYTAAEGAAATVAIGG